MDEIKLSDDVFERIKDFNGYWELTEKQRSLIDKLILNEELKQLCKENGLCKECKWIKRNYHWCNYCHVQQYSKNWTSEDNEVDKFIQKTQLKAENEYQFLEWVEYDKFENIEYFAKGGFGTTYKAIWKDGCIKFYGEQWERSGETKVALKCLHDSQNITVKFLKRIESYILTSGYESGWIVRCFGITKDPKTNNFIMLESKNGYIARGLAEIHNDDDETYVTDLGLCQRENDQSDNKKIYEVLPYEAPEVLREKEYTQASDIYGFGNIAYEVCTRLPPYHDMAHDEFLAIKICQGLRPKSNYKIPQPIVDIINQCWDANPSERPEVHGLYELFTYLNHSQDIENSAFYKHFKEVDEINKKSTSSTVQSPSSSTS
ncbi:hypothetical protein RclHR1_07730013 [Rhizophagus clarus]|uniref:Kinase-like domain-containing protein n=1 Tax=Rhizophagus clarus TaxID=94130 RepID=A0A2Z6SD31_9GLOM|nr:hypothetical protein RclHR1_07730013 [Rhizophagus clarus]GES74600.1 kinase-like domain-containing protein [Rhizophagus clarus]